MKSFLPVFPFTNAFELIEDDRKIITFPVKSSYNLISLVTPLSVLIFTKFVVIRLSTTIFIMGFFH